MPENNAGYHRFKSLFKPKTLVITDGKTEDPRKKLIAEDKKLPVDPTLEFSDKRMAQANPKKRILTKKRRSV